MRVFALLLLALGTAWAGAVAQTSTLSPPPSPPAPSGANITLPVAAGALHECDESQYYPVEALRNAFEGATLLQFKITRDGHISDISVIRSSGRQDVDDASVACAKTWLYRPAMKDGVPVEVVHRAIVRWQIAVTSPFKEIDTATYRCIASTKEGRDELRHATLHPVLKVHFSNGRVAGVTLVASSDIPDFDRRAIDCYSNLTPDLTSKVEGERDELFVAYVPN